MMTTTRRAGWVTGAAMVCLAFLAAPMDQRALAAEPTIEDVGELSYSRDVQPILASACFACHGFDSGSREAELRLDVAEEAFADRGGYAAIVPGEPMESEIYFRMTEPDERDRMPPQEHHHHPDEEEIAIIKAWIEQGAEYEDHWAFMEPEKRDLPEVSDPDWARNEIDYFVMQRLDEEGLEPSPEADRATLIRRVSLDLTGLPPTEEQVESFVNAPSPTAYEDLVERLLASPRYGEHMARYWLDAARYGDTHGLHLDNYREMWPYRDWVIRAFNQNMPFDQFTIEQLAGDLLEDPTRDQIIATGFNRAHVSTNEGGVIEDEVFFRNVTDRTETVGTVFLGLTFNCAQCHDHKYDAITTEEYYSLYAFFNSLDGSPLDGNAAQHPPITHVPNEEQEAQLASLEAAIADAEQRLAERREASEEDYAAWLAEAPAQWDQQQEDVISDAAVRFRLNEGEGFTVASADGEIEANIYGDNVQWEHENVLDHEPVLAFDGYTYLEASDGVGAYERDEPFSYAAWVYLDDRGGAHTIMSRMDSGSQHRGWDMYLSDGRVMAHLIHAWPDNAIRVNTREQLEQDRWQHVAVTYDGSSKAEGVAIYVDGEARELEVTHDSLSESIVAEVDFRIGRRTDDTPLRNGLVSEVTLFDRALSAEEVSHLADADEVGPILAIAEEDRTDEQRQQLRAYYLNNEDEAYQEIYAELASARQERSQLEESLPTTLIWRELDEPRQAYVMERGAYDQPGDPVERRTPEALPPMADDLPRDRLGLAKWLLSDEHPLTSRVTVNRFWQQVFGRGLVPTPEDFGIQGELPTHPDLLDYLAVNFRENGWDVQDLMRKMVLSSTYRQQSARSPQLQDIDPANELLARGPRFRLDGEVLRDQALAVSGLLVEQVGGPGVRPPQPEGLWEAVGYTASNTAQFEADTGRDNVHRRSIYTFWKRTSPPPQMEVFDAPTRESCSVRRERTNTPLQALAVLNDVQFFEPARALGELAMVEGGASAEERATWMFRRVTAREPHPVEKQEVLGLYEHFAADFAAHPEDAAELIRVGETEPNPLLDESELAAWAMVGNLLLNLDEVLNKN